MGVNHFKSKREVDKVLSLDGEKREERPPEPVHPKNLMETKVKEVMNRRPRAVSSDTSIEGLLERLLGQIEDCFPVINKNQKLLGIVTESDVLHVLQVPMRRAIVGHAMIKEAMKRSARNVSDIMTKRPITVTPETTIQETLNLMTAHKLRHLPVVEGERLVGLVCLRDIIELYHVLR